MNHVSRDHQRDHHAEGEQVAAQDVHAADGEDDLLRADQVGDRLLVAAPPQQADVLQDEREPDRRDQRRELGRVAQRPVGDPLDEHVQRAGHGHGEQQRDEQAAGEAERRRGQAEPERAPQADGGEGADHEDVAVREVDQLDDAVDERVADRDQRPDRAVGQPLGEVEAELGQVVVDHRLTRDDAGLVAGDQVADAVVDGQRGERRDQTPATGMRRRSAASPAARRGRRGPARGIGFRDGRERDADVPVPSDVSLDGLGRRHRLEEDRHAVDADLVEAVGLERRVAVLVEPEGAEHRRRCSWWRTAP